MPTDVALANGSAAGNRPADAVAGVLRTADPNVGADTAVFSRSGDSLPTAASFDYEAGITCRIRVWSLDQEGLCFKKDFSSTVTERNELP